MMESKDRFYGAKAEKSIQEVSTFLQHLKAWSEDLSANYEPNSHKRTKEFYGSDCEERLNGKYKNPPSNCVSVEKLKNKMVRPILPPEISCESGFANHYHTVMERSLDNTSLDNRGSLYNRKVKPKAEPASQQESPNLNFNLKEDVIKGKALANDLKLLGNAAFKLMDYSTAIKYYSKAMKYNPDDPILFGNRAQAFIKTGEYRRAISDCDIALIFDPTYIKALFRRAMARINSGDADGGKTDLILTTKLDPGNKEALAVLESIKLNHVKRSRPNLKRFADTKDEPPSYGCQPKEEMARLLPPPYKLCEDVVRKKSSNPEFRSESDINTTQNKLNPPPAPIACKEAHFPRTIFSIEKPTDLQSKRPMLRINVNVVGAGKSKGESSKRDLDVEGDMQEYLRTSRAYRLGIPPLPKTAIQFALDWKNLQDYPDRSAMYLKQMKAEEFSIFKDASIDYALLSKIIDTLIWEFMPRKWDFSEQLMGITRINRVGTLIFLLQEKYKAALKKLISECPDTNVCEYYETNFGFSL